MGIAESVVRPLRQFGFGRIPYFLVVGPRGSELAERLADEPGLVRAESAREASLLLICGEPPQAAAEPVSLLYHQLPRPRAAAWLGERRPDWLWPAVADGTDRGTLRDHLAAGGDAPEAAPEVALRRSEWEGVGPHGQGGKGMMGGEPYGRPMAMTMPDRDGLELDRWIAWIGAYHPHLPAGLAYRLELQGDIVQEATAVAGYMAAEADEQAPWRNLGRDAEPFGRALLTGEPALDELARARARSHLRWLASFLGLTGLDASARAARALALTLDRAGVARLRRRLERDPLLWLALRGLAPVEPDRAEEIGGPVARAGALGGDAYARLLQRLAELEEPLEGIEGPRGPLRWNGSWHTPSASLRDLGAEVAPGLEWRELVLALASLDLDVEEAEA